MNQAEQVRQIANEVIYRQYSRTIYQILKLIYEAAKDGQYKIILLATEFPELNNPSVQNWFIQSGFKIINPLWDSIRSHKIEIYWTV